MKIESYTYLLANPQKITSEDLTALDRVVQKYPFFQSARALQLKGLKNQESFRYNEALKIAAAHTTDRDILFEYITSEKFIQNEISQSILQQDATVLEIDVLSEDISENIRIEKDNDWQVEREKADAILNPNLFQRKVQSVKNIVTKTETTTAEAEVNSEEILETDKPLEFTKNDTHSFSEWLKLTKAKPIERPDENLKKGEIHSQQTVSNQKNKNLEALDDNKISSEANLDEEKDRKFELIDKFIQERPKITPGQPANRSSKEFQKKDSLNSKIGQETLHPQPTDSLMTETLARVYLQQKNYKKAIQAYKILILKNPEKSGFFADQIRAIEKSINTEEQ